MKLKSHFFTFFILILINFGISWFILSALDEDAVSKKIPNKIKFKSAQKEEALVIKTNEASGTTKLEINMIDIKGNNVVEELKAKVNPENLRKLKYKYKDDNDEKRSIFVIKYSENDDDFKVFLERAEKEALVCKVKFGLGKLKIGADEECTKAYEIKNISERKKKKYISKLKVYNLKGDYVASVSKSSESGKYKVKRVVANQENKEDLYSTKDLKYLSYAVGVMGLEEMDPKLRAVIVAEILKKGK